MPFFALHENLALKLFIPMKLNLLGVVFIGVGFVYEC